MRDIKITKGCVIANMYRVIEILESGIDKSFGSDDYKQFAELKTKMHEIRRDTKEIEKYL